MKLDDPGAAHDFMYVMYVPEPKDPELSPDALSDYEGLLSIGALSNPWTTSGGNLFYVPDLALLRSLLAVPIRTGSSSESGRLPKALDAWVAHELRRSGFPPDEVYPRRTQPRVLPREVGLFVEGLPQELRERARTRLLKASSVAPSDSRILGRAYIKQVDVVMSQWARGPEILISTKGMTGSFRNNLPNRFEESYGDAKNLRGRHPLAAMGFLFLLRSTVLADRGAVSKAVDMLRKLRAEGDVYDATGLVIAGWSDGPEATVELLEEEVPTDLRADQFLATIVDKVLERTPVDLHVEARERRDKVRLGLEDEQASHLDDEGRTLPLADQG